MTIPKERRFSVYPTEVIMLIKFKALICLATLTLFSAVLYVNCQHSSSDYSISDI